MSTHRQIGSVTVLEYGDDTWAWSVGVTHWRLLGRVLQAYLPEPYTGRWAWTAVHVLVPSLECGVFYARGWERSLRPAPIHPQEQSEAEGGAE